MGASSWWEVLEGGYDTADMLGFHMLRGWSMNTSSAVCDRSPITAPTRPKLRYDLRLFLSEHTRFCLSSEVFQSSRVRIEY